MRNRKEMRIAAIVQAHMGSTRLPGKVMKLIDNKPMLWHVLWRLRKSKFLDEVIVATTEKKADQVIFKFAQSLGLNVFAGSEENVLDRYYRTAKKYKIRIVVRVTSDCPLIDPWFVDKAISTYLEQRESLDLVYNGKTFPVGCAAAEVFSFEILQRIWQEAKSPYEREHVTPYIYWNPQLFRIKAMEHEKDLSHLRLVVDHENDLKLVKEIFYHLGSEKQLFHLKEIVRLLDYKPELLKINRIEVEKYSLMEKSTGD